MKKILLISVLSILMIIGITNVCFAKENDIMSFMDVKHSSWYFNAVKFNYKNDFIKGYDDEKFGPNDNLTRGMLVTILYRMENSPENNGISGFNDVENNKWYSKAIKWAVENEIVHGYGGNEFGPNDNILRQDLAVILRNYAKSKGKDVKVEDQINGFSDTDNISKYAESAMKWAVKKEVITGNENGTLNPKGNATRAEVAAMVQKYCTRVEKMNNVTDDYGLERSKIEEKINSKEFLEENGIDRLISFKYLELDNGESPAYVLFIEYNMDTVNYTLGNLFLITFKDGEMVIEKNTDSPKGYPEVSVDKEKRMVKTVSLYKGFYTYKFYKFSKGDIKLLDEFSTPTVDFQNEYKYVIWNGTKISFDDYDEIDKYNNAIDTYFGYLYNFKSFDIIAKDKLYTEINEKMIEATINAKYFSGMNWWSRYIEVNRIANDDTVDLYVFGRVGCKIGLVTGSRVTVAKIIISKDDYKIIGIETVPEDGSYLTYFPETDSFMKSFFSKSYEKQKEMYQEDYTDHY